MRKIDTSLPVPDAGVGANPKPTGSGSVTQAAGARSMPHVVTAAFAFALVVPQFGGELPTPGRWLVSCC